MGVGKSFWRQLFMVFIVSLGTIICGSLNGWPAPALSKLQSGKSIFNITEDEGEALTLYAEIGHFVAPIPGGLLADYFGRKPMFTIAAAGSLIGWALLTFTSSLFYYSVARIVLGFGFGIYCMLMSIYIAEISSQNIRGAFASTSMFSFNIGILLQYVLGCYLPLRQCNAITFALCVIQILSLFFVKESPYFLVASKQDERAKRCLSWLRGSNSDAVQKEFTTIKDRVEARESLLVSAKNLFSRNNFKGFVYCMIVSGLADLSGRVAILAYTTTTFKELAGADSTKSSNRMTMFLGIVNVIFPIIPILLSDKVGRKTIIMVSSIMIVFSHSLSGFVYWLQHDLQWLRWVLFGSLTGYLSSISTCVTIVLTLRGELISENCRGLASGFSSMAVALSVSVSTSCFVATQKLGFQYAFWLLACFSVPLIFFTWFFIPETKNKSFEEIQMALYGVKVKEYEDIESTKM